MGSVGTLVFVFSFCLIGWRWIFTHTQISKFICFFCSQLRVYTQWRPDNCFRGKRRLYFTIISSSPFSGCLILISSVVSYIHAYTNICISPSVALFSLDMETTYMSNCGKSDVYDITQSVDSSTCSYMCINDHAYSLFFDESCQGLYITECGCVYVC